MPPLLPFNSATNGINQIIGGILAYGLSHIKSPVMKSWQVLFLLYGFVLFSPSPISPFSSSRHWLTEKHFNLSAV